MGFDNFVFAQEDVAETKDFKEAIEWAENRKKNIIPKPAQNVKVSEKGEIVLEGEAITTTEWAFVNFCRLLGIPKPFAYAIPDDLLLTITHRLATIDPDRYMKFHRTEKGIIGVTSDRYDPVDVKDCLIQIAATNDEMKELELQGINLSDRGIDVKYLNNELPNLEPEVGDITKIGYSVKDSDTGSVDLQARAYLYTLQCENGAVLPNEWACLRRLKNKKLSKETSVLNFMTRLKNFQMKTDRLAERFNLMGKTPITDKCYYKYWRSLRSITGESRADDIFETEKDKRKEIAKKIRCRDRANKECIFSMAPEQPDEEMDMTYYKIYSRITNATKRYRLDKFDKLQELGGRMLTDMLAYSKN
jgi:hypothetical protein